jgi:hypothetical protein
MSLASDARFRLPPLTGLFLAVAVAGAAALWPRPSAAAAGPFQAFIGDWTGGGQIVGSNGVREHIRCRASYSESKGGEAMSQTIVCASPDYRIDIQSYARASGRSVQGTWSEATRGVSGRLIGTVEGGLFEGAVYGPGFTTGVSLRSNGRRQAVAIQPSPGSDIAYVRIELERRG